jgi:hypothetical protein
MTSAASLPADSPYPVGFTTERARALVALGAQRGVTLRVLGGVAIALRAAAPTPPALLRASNDLDFAVAEGEGHRAGEVLLSGGLVALSGRFNALHGHRRLIFIDAMASGAQGESDRLAGAKGAHTEGERAKVDVFVGDLEMCHTVPLRGRLEDDPLTLAPTDLLLSKGQIVRLTAKDRLDIYCLLWNHDVVPADTGSAEPPPAGALDAGYIAALCARDWGWWRTLSANLDACSQMLPKLALPDADRARIAHRLTAVEQAIQAAPKSLRWRARDRLGDRVRWYEDPEEIAALGGDRAAAGTDPR